MNYIERYEGYNTEAIREINRDLNTIGYRRGHYSYGVLTYMDMDIPIISQNLEIPVYSKTDKIYKFKK